MGILTQSKMQTQIKLSGSWAQFFFRPMEKDMILMVFGLLAIWSEGKLGVVFCRPLALSLGIGTERSFYFEIDVPLYICLLSKEIQYEHICLVGKYICIVTNFLSTRSRAFSDYCHKPSLDQSVSKQLCQKNYLSFHKMAHTFQLALHESQGTKKS